MIDFGKKYRVKNEDEMLVLGEDFASILVSGSIVTLNGSLGAGKTVFVKGIANYLKIDEPIISPTFTLVQHYTAGVKKLYHLDLYRLSDPTEFDLIDGRYILSSDSIVCVEWSALINDYLKDKKYYSVEISIDQNGDREVQISKVGD